VYGGGRRRSSGRSSGCAGFIAVIFVVGLVVIAIMWPLSLLGHAIGLTPSWHQRRHRDHIWEHQHYPLVGLRYVGAAAIMLSASVVAAHPFRVMSRRRVAERARLVAEQAAEQERRARDAHEAWLAGPAPFLHLPGRFTQNWILQNAPELHPGQVPALLDELRRRGWTDGDIQRRVVPYLPDDSSPSSS
jgi:hypothetical protein